MSVLQTEKFLFGTARLYATPSGQVSRVKYAGLNDVEFDGKVDTKEYYGEGGWPIFAADGHRSLDITAKHYVFDQSSFASDLGAAVPAAGQWAYAVDEAVTVPAMMPFTVTLANGALLVSGTLDLVMIVVTGSIQAPVTYKIVAAGMEVAGASCSVSGVGVITFAAGDTGRVGKATYKYTSAAGKQIAIVNAFQNSTPFYQMECVKRDLSQIDNSTGYFIFTLNAVRFSGFKLPFKEGELANIDRTFKAFADPTGIVGYVTFSNP
ncbi:MAG: hypothetical protein ACR2KS_10125 [Candidatus Eremiobacter antarcticus]|nr:hypothetical protein [Candidatus Eremiobacteraeota bacterium]MBC5808790.1 hypothetical protein [Candidatus Eremiobacteraeota bacterium]